MIRITVKPDNTIEEIVKGLVKEASENNSCPKIIADFTNEGNLNSRFAGAGYNKWDRYDITLAVEIGGIIKEVIIQLNYNITNGQDKLIGNYSCQDKKRLIGNYTSPDNSKETTGKKELSSVMGHTITEPVNIRLMEVGFTPLGRNRECLYKETEDRKEGTYSKIKTIFDNIKGDLSLMAYSLYSNEPSLVRYRRSAVMPWLILGTIFAAASVIGSVVISYYSSR